MKPTLAGCPLSLLLILGASFASEPVEQRRALIRFHEDLRYDDVRLAGNTAMLSVPFHWPDRWQALSGSALHLFVAHSHDLDGDRSFLSVTMNCGILRSVRLAQPSAQSAEVIVPLPPSLIQPSNELVFSAMQFARPGTSPWTIISAKSYLEIRYVEKSEPPNLGQLPLSFLDPNPYAPARLAVLAPATARPSTLEAIALLVAALTNRLRPRDLNVRIVRSAVEAGDAPLLVAGTPQEQAYVRAMAPPLEGLSLSEGLVALERSRARPPVLMATGKSPGAVLRAARHLAAGAAMSGSSFRVKEDLRLSPPAPREWKGFMPPRSRFSLSELGWSQVPIGSLQNPTAALDVNATPDARFFPYGHQVVLKFRLQPELYDPGATLAIEWNGNLLAEAALAKIGKGYSAAISLPVNAELLRPRNRLKITWHSLTSATAHGVAAWLLGNSEFYLPRDYQTDLPELALLQHRFFPFSLSADFHDVIVVLPNMAAEPLLPALVELAAAIGREAPASGMGFRVKPVSELMKHDAETCHLIALHVQGVSNPLAATRRNGRPPLEHEVPRGMPLLRESVSPWNSERFILMLAAPSASALELGVRRAFSEPTLSSLKWDAAYLTPGQPLCFRLEQQHSVRQYSLGARLEAWLRTYWLLLPVVMIVVSAMLFAGLRLALVRYRGGHSSPPGTATSGSSSGGVS